MFQRNTVRLERNKANSWFGAATHFTKVLKGHANFFLFSICLISTALHSPERNTLTILTGKINESTVNYLDLDLNLFSLLVC